MKRSKETKAFILQDIFSDNLAQQLNIVFPIAKDLTSVSPSPCRYRGIKDLISTQKLTILLGNLVPILEIMS